MESIDAVVRRIMKGAYDLHAHPQPSHFKRCIDDFEFARRCDEYEMGGAMLKSHYDPTAGRAIICNRYSGARARMLGGVALNRPVGGLNPCQVECSLKMGAVIVWLPTRDAAHIMKRGGKETDFLKREPIEVLDGDGKPVPEIYEIFAVMKKYGAYLATGHISPEESMVICREGAAQGVNMILTHPDSKTTGMSVEAQAELAGLGVMVEKVWDNVLNGYISAGEMAERIRTIGASRCFMSTDNGQPGKDPVKGMYDFIRTMLEQGLSESELMLMTHANPEKIINAAHKEN